MRICSVAQNKLSQAKKHMIIRIINRKINMKRVKQILAWIGIIVIVGLYVVTIVLGLTANENTVELLKAAVVATIVVPVLIWAYTFIYKLLKGNRFDQNDPDANK